MKRGSTFCAAATKRRGEDPEGFKDALQKDLQKDDVDLSTPALALRADHRGTAQ